MLRLRLCYRVCQRVPSMFYYAIIIVLALVLCLRLCIYCAHSCAALVLRCVNVHCARVCVVLAPMLHVRLLVTALCLCLYCACTLVVLAPVLLFRLRLLCIFALLCSCLRCACACFSRAACSLVPSLSWRQCCACGSIAFTRIAMRLCCVYAIDVFVTILCSHLGCDYACVTLARIVTCVGVQLVPTL